MTVKTRNPAKARALGIALLLCAAPGLAAASDGRTVLPPPRPASLDRQAQDEAGRVSASRALADRDITTGSTRKLADGGEGPGSPLPITRIAAAAGPALSDRAAIEKANALLNGISTLVADFTQLNGDGRRASGILYLQRPGKLRFEYDKPSTLEVVSDGSTVLVRDRKLNTADPYPIGQTPLKFLLDTRIDIARTASLRGVQTEGDTVRIAIEDTSTLGGSSKITMTFDRDVQTLKGWRVIDPQGYTTTVTLSNQDRNKPIDPHVFMLNYMRPVD